MRWLTKVCQRRSIKYQLLITSPKALSVVCRTVVRIPHKLFAGSKQTVRELQTLMSSAPISVYYCGKYLTASKKSPAADMYVWTTCGVTIRVVAVMISSGGTSTGRSLSVRARRRFTRSNKLRIHTRES